MKIDPELVRKVLEESATLKQRNAELEYENRCLNPHENTTMIAELQHQISELNLRVDKQDQQIKKLVCGQNIHAECLIQYDEQLKLHEIDRCRPQKQVNDAIMVMKESIDKLINDLSLQSFNFI